MESLMIMQWMIFPGSALKMIFSVAVADMNNDGMLDIIFGNVGQNNQLLKNAGDGKFDGNSLKDLPGGVLKTISVPVADMNNNGMLDLIIGNWGQLNQLLSYSSCKNGGARLHSKIGCFGYPSLMGKVNSICRECIPDCMQRPRTFDY